MEYILTSKALRQLEKLSPMIQQRIIKKLDFFCSQGDPLEFAERILDPRLGEYRFRIGDYRVVFDVRGNLIVVLLVGNRKEIYR